MGSSFDPTLELSRGAGVMRLVRSCVAWEVRGVNCWSSGRKGGGEAGEVEALRLVNGGAQGVPLRGGLGKSGRGAKREGPRWGGG